jgi:general secretion pathway protein H
VLLDMVLALAVAALVMLVVWPTLPRGTSAARQGAYAAEVAAMLKTDRNAAAARGREVATRVEVASRRIASGATGRAIELPRDLALDVIASNLCSAEPGAFSIIFAADGRSCGAVIRIVKADRDWRIRINWLTGYVDVVAPGRG